jgi:hypothetical protein
VLRLDTSAAQPILDVFRGADPGVVAADNTVVRVLNGTATAGLAEEAAAGLRALGFVVPPDNTGDAGSTSVAVTTVRYAEGSEEQALLVSRALAADPAVEEVASLSGADVAVVIGADWSGVAPSLRAPTPGLVPLPAGDGAAPSTTPGTDGSAAVPTSTPPGEVPSRPPDASC